VNSLVYYSLQIWWRASGFTGGALSSRFPGKLFYIISHERSGTHFLINTLLLNLKIRRGKGLGDGAGWGFHNMGEWYGPYNEPEHRFDHLKNLKSAWNELSARAAIIKTHSDAELFRQTFPDAPALYILRDPRDTLVSWYHYLNQNRYYRIHPWLENHRCSSFSEFLRRPVTEFLRGAYSLNGGFSNVAERWAAHVAGWLHQQKKEICLVRFSVLKNESEETVRRIAEFLGVECKGRFRTPGLLTAPSMLPRKGVVGDWKTLATEEDEGFIRDAAERYGLVWNEVTDSE